MLISFDEELPRLFLFAIRDTFALHLTSMNAHLSVMMSAARAGGKILRSYFGNELAQVQKTKRMDFCTKADLSSEKLILARLRKAFPSYNTFAEESGKLPRGSEWTFIVDPLDGTYNFVMGVPEFSIPIVLTRGSSCIASVVYHPMLDLMYYAEKGSGAFVNGKRIRVNHEPRYRYSTIAYVGGYHNTPRTHWSIINKIVALHCRRMVNHWSPALDFCLLASGKIEGVVNNNSEIYDFLAGKLIAMEAGAKITDFKGRGEKTDLNSAFVASNGRIHAQLLRSVR